MDFGSFSDDALIELDITTLTFEQRQERIFTIVRKILWQDIVAKGVVYRNLAINICRYQEGSGLRCAERTVDAAYESLTD